MQSPYCFFFFFFNDTATTEIYTLSLHDALPISMSYSRHCTDCLRATQSKRACTHFLKIHRSEEHTSELQSHSDLVCRLLLEKKKTKQRANCVVIVLYTPHDDGKISHCLR